MKAYIINLERSPERKAYMQNLLQVFPSFVCDFISAVDGKAMSEEMRKQQFDIDKFYLRYSVYPRPGEIGCTLSHQKCYRKVVSDNEPYVLILEDDIVLPSKGIYEILPELEKRMISDTPQIILLSGWYWYYNTHNLAGNYRLANIYDAFLTHAYMINQPAARILIENKPCITADDWRYIRKKGVRLQAVLPHLIEQKCDGSLATTVNIEAVGKRCLKWRLLNSPHLLLLKLLEFFGHYEKA